MPCAIVETPRRHKHVPFVNIAFPCSRSIKCRQWQHKLDYYGMFFAHLATRCGIRIPHSRCCENPTRAKSLAGFSRHLAAWFTDLNPAPRGLSIQCVTHWCFTARNSVTFTMWVILQRKNKLLKVVSYRASLTSVASSVFFAKRYWCRTIMEDGCWCRHFMIPQFLMASCHRHIQHTCGHLCLELTDYQWIPSPRNQ